MHIADVSKGNLGANGIVAGGIPIAVGAGLALKLQGTDKVALSFFGDGATSEGAFHEAVNLAAIWDLPVVFVCENNHYGMSMSVEEVSRLDRVADRAAGYGIPGVTVDGNDVDAVHRAATEAVERARSGQGPTLVEAVTYRWKGHSKSDQNLYRTREEIESWRARDPIERFEQVVLEATTLSEDEVKQVRDQARDAVRDAVRAGQTGPAPSRDLLAGVYAPSEVDARTYTGDGAPAAPAPAEGAEGAAVGPVAAAAGARGRPRRRDRHRDPGRDDDLRRGHPGRADRGHGGRQAGLHPR